MGLLLTTNVRLYFLLSISDLFSQLGNMLTEIYQNCPSYRDFYSQITINMCPLSVL